jgi:Flp pilus assembly secretin CpaC
LRDSLTTLAHDVSGSLRDLLPIVLVITVFQIFVFEDSATRLLSMAGGGLLVVMGLAFFIFGLRLALFPVGEGLANALARKGSVFWLIVFAFVLGFGTTIAEPALIAIAAEAAEVAAAAGEIAASAEARKSYALSLRLTVAFAVGVALVIGVMRILSDWSLPLIIISGYCLVVLLTTIAPKEIVGVAYDSGGVTTSTVTVPLVTALGVGLAGSLKGRNPMTDGFGLIAFASLTPILFVLTYGIILQWI